MYKYSFTESHFIMRSINQEKLFYFVDFNTKRKDTLLTKVGILIQDKHFSFLKLS